MKADETDAAALRVGACDAVAAGVVPTYPLFAKKEVVYWTNVGRGA